MATVAMESEKETHSTEGVVEEPRNDVAEPKTETPTEAGKDESTGGKDNDKKNSEQSKGGNGEGEDSGSVAKEEPTLTPGETANGTPKNIEKDDLKQSQTGGDETNKVDENKETSDTETQKEPGDGTVDADTNAVAKESSPPGPSPLEQEPRIVPSEELDGKVDENEEIKPGEMDIDKAQNKDVETLENDTKFEEKEDSAATEKTSEGVSSDEPKASAEIETDQSPSANHTNTTEKEGETSSSEKQSKSGAEFMEEKQDTDVAEPPISHTDESTTVDTKDKSFPDKDEDEKTKVDAESKNTESNNHGGISENKEGVSMEIERELVQSTDVKADSNSEEKASVDPVAGNAVAKDQELEIIDDTFDDFRKKQSLKKKKKTRPRKQKSLKIKIAGMSTEITKIRAADKGSPAVLTPDKPDFAISCHDSLIPDDYNMIEKELEDSLAFFEQPHEDQDPMHMEFINKEKRDRITMALKNLQAQEESGKKEITLIVNKQLKDKQESTERYIEKHRQKLANDQKSDLTRLQQAYATKSRSNKGKIDHGVQVLRKKHNDENQKILQQHRQQVQQRRVPEQIANAEWQQIAQRLSAKHNRQMHDFARKGKEVMNKYKLEYERERTKITQAYAKRVKDLNTNRQNLYRRIYATLQQIRTRHLKKHFQSVAERREEMKLELASTEVQPTNETTSADQKILPSVDKPKSDERADLRPVSPIKTASDWLTESSHEPSGAATRHKHRKGVLSQILRQLSVEIHNEGIWLSVLSEKKNNPKSPDNTATTQSDKKYFFPWGVKARKILESIVCGEIPHACADSSKFDFSETVAQYGGHLRCIMTDLRTSDATASAQRAEAIMKKVLDEVKKLEERGTAIRKNIAEQQKNIEIIRKQQHDLGLKYKETVKDYEKTKQHLQAFRTKYANFFGPDGKPLPTNDPNDTRKLTQHGMKYKMAIESSEKRGTAIKAKIAELQASLQKRETSNKSDARTISSLNTAIKSKRHIINEVRSGRLNLLQTKSIENPANRVKETINILGVTADMRRDQLNQKRNSNTSSHWVQSLPGLPGTLRRSLWYKMHRRRQQIVLRPTFSSMLTNMRKEIESKLNSIDTGVRRGSKETTEDKLIRAEQSYLLATHPVEQMDEDLTSLPSSSSWAEPGWYLKLNVERDDSKEDRILPCHPRQTLVQHNLSELYSAPGSQAAAMITSTHLRSLETPLSAVATATSLSETDPAMSKSADPILMANDPLRMTRDALKSGYSFSMTKVATAVRPTTVTRRKSASTKDTASTVSSKTSKKKQSASASDSGVSRTSGASGTPTSSSRADNSRKRKSTSHSDPASTPRAVQRKRVEPPRQQIPVDDQAFQPRPIMTQPQQQQQQQQQPQQAQQPFLQQAMPQQQQNPYNNQFMNAMPSPVAPQQQATHRGSFNQFQNAPQMNQFRMMQQQQSHHQQQHHHQQHSNQQKVQYGQMQQQPMRPNPQFFPQMGQQQFQQPMQMPGQGGMQMNLNNPVQRNMATQDEQNDPLFMLK